MPEPIFIKLKKNNLQIYVNVNEIVSIWKDCDNDYDMGKDNINILLKEDEEVWCSGTMKEIYNKIQKALNFKETDFIILNDENDLAIVRINSIAVISYNWQEWKEEKGSFCNSILKLRKAKDEIYCKESPMEIYDKIQKKLGKFKEVEEITRNDLIDLED
jgi:hypothetical protein